MTDVIFGVENVMMRAATSGQKPIGNALVKMLVLTVTPIPNVRNRWIKSGVNQNRGNKNERKAVTSIVPIMLPALTAGKTADLTATPNISGKGNVFAAPALQEQMGLSVKRNLILFALVMITSAFVAVNENHLRQTM